MQENKKLRLYFLDNDNLIFQCAAKAWRTHHKYTVGGILMLVFCFYPAKTYLFLSIYCLDIYCQSYAPSKRCMLFTEIYPFIFNVGTFSLNKTRL